jgi:hypothetical protein
MRVEMGADELDLQRRLWNVVEQESVRFGVRYAAFEDERIAALINRADEAARESGRISVEDAIVVEEKLRLILTVATRWEFELRRPGEGRVSSVSVDALGFALSRLCPLWPFC